MLPGASDRRATSSAPAICVLTVSPRPTIWLNRSRQKPLERSAFTWSSQRPNHSRAPSYVVLELASHVSLNVLHRPSTRPACGATAATLSEKIRRAAAASLLSFEGSVARAGGKG